MARKIVAIHPYHDEEGQLLFEAVRFQPKDFRQRRPDGRGGWNWSLNGVRRVLYRLPELKGKVAVFLVEGERDVERLRSLGLTATTNPMGAGKWREEYADQLKAAGVQRVATLPDNDEPGEKHALSVARSCLRVGLQVRVVRLEGLPDKGDVSDWLDRGHTKEELIRIAKGAPLLDLAALDAEAARTAAEEKAPPTACPVLIRVADVDVEPVEWLWPGRVPLRKVTVLDGDPGLGKSTMTLDLAARVSRGDPMPGERGGREPAGVVLLSAEDGIGDTIRPRLEAAAADLERIVVLSAIKNGDGSSRLPLLPDDVHHVREAAEQTGAILIVVDPLLAFLSAHVDSHRDQDVRGALRLLSELAQVTGASVLIVRHLNKVPGGSPMYRGGGSIGIIGAARSGLLVAPDPQDDTRRVLAMTKSNLAAPAPSLAYRLVEAGASSRVQWEGEVQTSAADLLAAQKETGESPSAGAEAESFLRDLLAAAPVKAKQVFKEAKEAGIADVTLRRTATRLGVKKSKLGMAEGWVWSLPPEDDQPAPEDVEDAHTQRVSTFGQDDHLRRPDGSPGLAPLGADGDPAAPTCPTCGNRLFLTGGLPQPCPTCTLREHGLL